jgi:hypothetical protein
MTNYLIDFKNSIDDETIQTYFSNNQCTLIKQYLKFEKVYLITSENRPPQTDIVESIQEDQMIQSISPLEITPVQYTSPLKMNLDIESEKDWWKVYSIKNIDFLNKNSSVDIYGEGVNVYIMDSGIDITHTEFIDQNISLLYSITNDYTDETGHGTAVASIIAGKTCGLTCPNIKIIKLWDSTHQALQSQILSALDTILWDSLNSSGIPSVVNMSWGIPKNSYIDSKIEILLDADIVVVAAAGNTGVAINDITPASIPRVITVGSYGPDFIPSNFSSYTDPTIVNLSQQPTNHGELDVWAPGEKIYAAQLNGEYGFVAGTSFSSAIYTGEVIYTMSQHLFRLSMNGTPIIYEMMDRFDRMGLLDLSDTKYINSKNKICTYAKNYQRDSSMVINIRNLLLWAKVGQERYVPFYIPEKTVSYELIGAIPEGIRIQDEFLIYAPTEETQDPEKIEQFKFQIKLSNIDQTEFLNNITLIKISNNYELSTVELDNDNIINITPTGQLTLGAICGSSFYANTGDCGYWSSNCNSNNCATETAKNGNTCNCA